MSIFISYSHDDAVVVEKIAKKLVENNIHVWIDKWELEYGDSLISKIQSAITNCSALLIMLSKKSVESEWCKKEVSVGLIRELDEKQVLVIPVILDDCQIPLFLRDKFYSDFRNDFDDAMIKLNDHLIKVKDTSMRRVRENDYLIDWAINYNTVNDKIAISIDSISFQKDLDYSILCIINIYTNINYDNHTTNYECIYNNIINNILLDLKKTEKYNILLSNSLPQYLYLKFSNYKIDVYIRRMGNNNPFDILFDYGSIFRCIEKVIS